MRTLRRVVPLVAGLALLAANAGCQWPDGTRYVHKVFTDVEVTRDIVYSSTTDYQGHPIDLKLDIYRPVGDTATNRPAVMWMYGGGFTSGDKNQLASYADDSAKRGYVGVAINYRLRATADIGAIIDAWTDSANAVAWLKAHAADYGINPDVIIAAGYSAGAVNAVHLLYLSDPSPVAGAVAIAGFTPVAPTAGDPPVIMHQGLNDTIVPPSSSQGTCDATRNAGNVCMYHTYPSDHLMTFVEPYATQIKDISATDMFEQILLQHGYEPEQLPAAA